MEVDSLSYRVDNIRKSYANTSHKGLRERLFSENQIIARRLNEIYSIAKMLKKRTNEEISISCLLVEKCVRTISKSKIERNLFFL